MNEIKHVGVLGMRWHQRKALRTSVNNQYKKGLKKIKAAEKKDREFDKKARLQADDISWGLKSRVTGSKAMKKRVNEVLKQGKDIEKAQLITGAALAAVGAAILIGKNIP